jgi:L-lactate dehydrogenase
MKIGIVGAGQVGSACTLATVLRGCAREIVLVNRDRSRAKGVVADIRYGATLASPVDLREGEYADLAGASLVMVTAGVNERAGGATDRNDSAGRLRLLDKNVEVYRQILPELAKAASDAVVLVLTDPPDPLADLVRGFGFRHVLSSGTFLDSQRFRYHLARHLRVDTGAIEAQVVGEHGTSQVFLWSSARVGGAPLPDLPRQSIEQEVRFANITIIEGTGASQYGIGVVASRIAEIVLRNDRTVIPIGSYNPKYGVTLSLPSLVSRAGVEKIFEPAMSDEERAALERSAQALRQAVERLQPAR